MGNTLFRCFCGCCMNSTEEYTPLVQQKSVYYGQNKQANRFVKCKLDLDSILNADMPEELQNELRMLHGKYLNILQMSENIANEYEKRFGYQQLPADHEEKIVPDEAKSKVEFNDYDDNININNDVLLIFGYIRDAQNSLSSDIAHHIVPQTVINMICNYCLKPNQSIFKIRLNFMKDKPLMSVYNAESIACNVKQVWVNGSSLFFLSPNDHIYVSGSNYKGTLGINSSADYRQSSVNKPQTTRFYQKHKFKIISSSSCSTEHSIAVTLNNKIYAFGSAGYYGRFGVENPSVKNSYTAKGLMDDTVEVFWPTLINIDTKYKIVDIRIGSEHSLFLTNNGKVFGCGNNYNKRLGTKWSFEYVKGIKLIQSLSNDTIIKIRCGQTFSLVLTDNGILKSFGENDKGQLGIGKVDRDSGFLSGHEPIIVAVAESSEPKITTMECGSAHSCCLDEFGNIYCWGANYGGQCGQYNAHSIPKPICLELKGIKILNIACGEKSTIAMDNEMNLYAFGECDSNTRYWNNERVDTSRIHVAKYHEFQNLIDSKKIIDIKAGRRGDVYLCVANH